MTTPLINPTSIRISFLNEEGSLTEVSGPTLGCVALAIDAELRRRDRNFVREQVIVMESGRIPCDNTVGLLEYQAMREDQNDDDEPSPDECDQCASTDVEYPYTTEGYLCTRCREALKGTFKNVE